jgi:hypothetical protein
LAKPIRRSSRNIRVIVDQIEVNNEPRIIARWSVLELLDIDREAFLAGMPILFRMAHPTRFELLAFEMVAGPGFEPATHNFV